MKRFILTLALLSSIGSFSQAKEGFSSDFAAAPSAVQQWSSRIFAVYSRSRAVPLGTAFLIYGDPMGLRFITAQHVIRDCANESDCALIPGFQWSPDTRDFPPSTSVVLSIRQFLKFEPLDPNWGKGLQAAKDLALVLTDNASGHYVPPPAGLNTAVLDSLSEQQTSRAHFVLGYPNLAVRPSLALLPESRTVRLQWSSGTLIGKQRMVSSGGFGVASVASSEFKVVSDADSLFGNSGGPVIDENGQLIGVLIGGPRSIAYTGHQPYSHIVPVDYVWRFLEETFVRGLLGIP